MGALTMTISNGGAVPEGVRFPLPPYSGELSATMKVNRPSNRQTGTLAFPAKTMGRIARFAPSNAMLGGA